MNYPVTLFLIAVTVLVSWMAFNNRKLADRLILWPPAIDRHKQYDRLLTYGFIHADFTHLLFNMITLFFFGRAIEGLMLRLSGQWWVFPLFYLSALLVSILPSYLKNQKNPIFVFFIPAPAVLYAVFYVGYSIWMDKKGGDNVNHSAHLAGAAYGVMFMLLMSPDLLQHFLQALMNPSFGR
jgi:membrane associated rhomboid family serine protease